jgi:translation initiation factor 2 beta subunit (eIF-2beta)/eIF-5
MININGNISDANYRYKMEKVSLNNCGSGNGQFTVINNMDNIGESINTPSEILYKYFAFVLGSSFNEKKKSLTGTYSVVDIEQQLYDYINKFVMCSNCNIPELMYKIEKKNVCACCSACGKNNNIQYNTKINRKVLDLIEKYLEKNKVWVKTKGLLVEQKEEIPEKLDKKTSSRKHKKKSEHNESDTVHNESDTIHNEHMGKETEIICDKHDGKESVHKHVETLTDDFNPFS